MALPCQSAPTCMFVSKIDGCCCFMSLSDLLVMQQQMQPRVSDSKPPGRPQVGSMGAGPGAWMTGDRAPSSTLAGQSGNPLSFLPNYHGTMVWGQLAEPRYRAQVRPRQSLCGSGPAAHGVRGTVQDQRSTAPPRGTRHASHSLLCPSSPWKQGFPLN